MMAPLCIRAPGKLQSPTTHTLPLAFSKGPRNEYACARRALRPDHSHSVTRFFSFRTQTAEEIVWRLKTLLPKIPPEGVVSTSGARQAVAGGAGASAGTPAS